ncbi:MAG: sulfite exporter TauE/SafE family protein [Pirellulales bacterium]|nr:sulfite exporter TauE/SafE family protein [Pirellulales bacterium]
MPTIAELVVLMGAAALAGAMNSIAGGGTFLTFPALVWSLGAGNEVAANVTSTIALCPGSFASAWAYRRELSHYGHWLKWLFWPSLLGSVAGTLLLLWGRPETFQKLIPWLILLATLLFALQPRILRSSGLANAGDAHVVPASNRRLGAILLFQTAIGLYGGYFGAGIGILMLSSLGLLGMTDIHGMNAVKTVLATLINAVALALFLWQDSFPVPGQGEIINWPRALPMVLAGVAGGYFGAHYGRLLDKHLLRRLIVLIGSVLTAWYFWRQWAG